MTLQRHAPLYTGTLTDHARHNDIICADFERQAAAPDIRRTHLFGGRYENIYIGLDRIPAMQPVMEQALAYAADILGRPSADLRAGFWFNAMPPGHVTTRHSHDDDDELLSGVYYLRVPARSGELILHAPPLTTHVSPREGLFVFFPPDIAHEVTENRSDAPRLSVGMNFGPLPT